MTHFLVSSRKPGHFRIWINVEFLQSYILSSYVQLWVNNMQVVAAVFLKLDIVRQQQSNKNIETGSIVMYC